MFQFCCFSHKPCSFLLITTAVVQSAVWNLRLVLFIIIIMKAYYKQDRLVTRHSNKHGLLKAKKLRLADKNSTRKQYTKSTIVMIDLKLYPQCNFRQPINNICLNLEFTGCQNITCPNIENICPHIYFLSIYVLLSYASVKVNNVVW